MGEGPGGGEDGENTAGLSDFTPRHWFSTGCSGPPAKTTHRLRVVPTEHLGPSRTQEGASSRIREDADVRSARAERSLASRQRAYLARFQPKHTTQTPSNWWPVLRLKKSLHWLCGPHSSYWCAPSLKLSGSSSTDGHQSGISPSYPRVFSLPYGISSGALPIHFL
jgi:hypothetical protein